MVSSLRNPPFTVHEIEGEKKNEILKRWYIAPHVSFYSERMKFFSLKFFSNDCILIEEAVFIPFPVYYGETQIVIVRVNTCKNKFVALLKGKIQGEEESIEIPFSKIEEGNDFSVWRGEWMIDIQELQRIFPREKSFESLGLEIEIEVIDEEANVTKFQIPGQVMFPIKLYLMKKFIKNLTKLSSLVN